MRPGPAIAAAALLAGLAATAAAEPRLALWLTDPVGTTDGSRCRQADGQALPARPPTLTEHDVVAWDPATGRWTLSPARFAGAGVGRALQDRCFVLALDGRVVSGIALSAHSARLIGFATLGVIERRGRLALQLTADNQAGPARPILVDALDAVLGRRTAPARP